jgi:hypothetical protein
MSTFAGVYAGEWFERTMLINTGVVGLSDSGTAVRMSANFTGGFAGSAAASLIFSAGAYWLGMADAAEARQAAMRGLVASVIMAGAKTTGMYTFFAVTGSSATALGPYIITYLAALGAVYTTDLLFSEAQKEEEFIRIGKELNSFIQ